MPTTPTDEQKQIIDKKLQSYPNLKQLIEHDDKHYSLDNENIYNHEIDELTTKIASANEFCKTLIPKLMDENITGEKFRNLLEDAYSHVPWFNWSEIYSGQVPHNPDNTLRQKICNQLREVPSIENILRNGIPSLIGGILLYSNDESWDDFTTLLISLEKILEKHHTHIISSNYSTKLLDDFFATYAELLVYDKLVSLEYSPEHEPTLRGTGVKPDFKVKLSEHQECFVEIKCRYSSFEEILQFEGLSRFLPETGFVNPDESTRKTLDVIISALEQQIIPLNSACPNTPAYLIILVLHNIMDMSLNVDSESLLSRWNERRKNAGEDTNVQIPDNLKGIGLIDYNELLKSEKIDDYLDVLRVYHINDTNIRLLEELKETFHQSFSLL